LPGAFTGQWNPLYWLGGEMPNPGPNVSNFLTMLMPPELLLKIFAPFSMFALGFGAWLFFRQLGLNPVVCALGGVAAGLNMHFLSNACWGLGNWNISFAMIFLGMAALSATAIRQTW